MGAQSTQSSGTSSSGSSVGIAAGVIGAIVTIVLYWINLAIFSQPFITNSGVWITIIISTFVTGYIASTVGR